MPGKFVHLGNNMSSVTVTPIHFSYLEKPEHEKQPKADTDDTCVYCEFVSMGCCNGDNDNRTWIITD